MIICIFIKWSISWPDSGANAPGILNLLLDLFLKKGSTVR